MWINNNADIKRFKDTVNKCEHSVWVVTPSGEKYDLKDSFGYYIGLASLLNSKDHGDPEVYAQTKADEALLLNYLNNADELLHAC